MNKNTLAMVETVVMGVVLETKFHKATWKKAGSCRSSYNHYEQKHTAMVETVVMWVIRDQVA